MALVVIIVISLMEILDWNLHHYDFGLWPCEGHEGPALLIMHPLKAPENLMLLPGVGPYALVSAWPIRSCVILYSLLSLSEPVSLK